VFAATHGFDETAEPASQEALGRRFDLTRDQVRYALEFVERRFMEVFCKEVRDEVASDAEAKEEVRELLDLLRPPLKGIAAAAEAKAGRKPPHRSDAGGDS
jgi:hypothetical protein